MADFTRSRTLAVATAARHPQAADAFSQATGSIFRQWTALELAVSHGWGGMESQEKFDYLVEDVIAMFDGKKRLYKDDIQLFLEDVLEQDFQTICEDGSPGEVGELLCTLYRECGEGDFVRVTNILNAERVRAGQNVMQHSQGLDTGTGDAILPGDVESDDGMEMEMEMGGIQEEEEMGMGMAIPSAPVGPIIDEDGFQTVTKKKGKGRGNF
jgi:pre-rRNA-processing protein TSR2